MPIPSDDKILTSFDLSIAFADGVCNALVCKIHYSCFYITYVPLSTLSSHGSPDRKFSGDAATVHDADQTVSFYPPTLEETSRAVNHRKLLEGAVFTPKYSASSPSVCAISTLGCWQPM